MSGGGEPVDLRAEHRREWRDAGARVLRAYSAWCAATRSDRHEQLRVLVGLAPAGGARSVAGPSSCGPAAAENVGDAEADDETTKALRSPVATHRQSLGSVTGQAPVFPTRTGTRRKPDNVRARVIAPTVRRANALREATGGSSLPPGVTPHTLRHTFISFLLEAGASPRYVMGQVGHADPKTTLRIYAQLLKRDRSGVGKALDELIHSRAVAGARTKTSALQGDGGGAPIAGEAAVFGPENGPESTDRPQTRATGHPGG